MEINSRIGSRKAQSAMEYLTTYGWAILIIGVVLAALAEMGLFNPSTYAQSICDLPANLFCKSFFLSTSGVLAVTIENTMQDPINITAVGCGNQPLANMQSITPVYLPQGHSYTFNVQCEGAANSHIGQLYAGYITLNYTDDVTLFSQTLSGKVIVKTVETSTTSSSTITTSILTSTTTSTTTSSTSITTSTSTSTSITSTSTSTTTSSTSTTTSTTTSSISTTTILYYYVPITLSNSQSSATPSPFQQMITVNSLAYEQYEAGGLTNVAFYNASGTQLDSWLESGNSNTSTNTVYWVKLPNGIPASSSITIYMRFYQPLSNMQFNSNNDGEAPQLSCPNPSNITNCSTYAEYDDGANVFNFYDNFAGTSLNTKYWSIETGPSTYSGYTVDNGLSVWVSGQYFVQLVSNFTVNLINYPVISDLYIASYSSSLLTGRMSNGFGSPPAYYLLTVPSTGLAAIYNLTNYDCAYESIKYPSNYIQSFSWAATNSEWAQVNYANTLTCIWNTFSISNYSLYIRFDEGSYTYVESAVYRWVRTRAYPPSGVMPSVSFGSLSHN